MIPAIVVFCVAHHFVMPEPSGYVGVLLSGTGISFNQPCFDKMWHALEKDERQEVGGEEAKRRALACVRNLIKATNDYENAIREGERKEDPQTQW